MLLHASADGREAPAFTPAATAIAAVACVLAVIEHIASALQARPLSPPHWAEHIIALDAYLRMVPDLALFEPWQLWSHALVQTGWWQLCAGVIGLLAVGGALESEIGIGSTLLAAATVLPLSTIGAVLEDSEPGLSSLVVGLGAVVLAREPWLRVRWRLSYYAITEVGSLRLLRMPLTLMLALYLAQELVRCHLQRAATPSLAWLGAAAMGAAVGIVSRRLLPPAPRPRPRPAEPQETPAPPGGSGAGS